jgi:hypothetical protein
MKIFKLFSTVAALVPLLMASPTYSQSISLNVGGVSQASCTYSSMTVDSTTGGTINVTCSSAVTTGGATPPPPGSYALTVAASPAAGATFACTNLGGACSATYPTGTVVPVYVTPATGYTFSTWASGPCVGTTASPCSVTMNAAVSMTATMTVNGGGGGGTTPPPNGVVMITTPPLCGTGLGSTGTYTAGTTYSFPLPKTSTGTGTLAISAESGIGTNVVMEVSFSQTPGDWTTAQNATQLLYGVIVYHPWYLKTGGYPSMTWANPGSGNVATVDTSTQQWYANIRTDNLSGFLNVQLSSPNCN